MKCKNCRNYKPKINKKWKQFSDVCYDFQSPIGITMCLIFPIIFPIIYILYYLYWGYTEVKR
jgi:hypothetical protein